MRKLVACVLALVMISSAAPVVYASDSNSSGNLGADDKTRVLYDLADGGAYDIFTNYVDGYSLQVDKGMNVDMSYSGVGTVLKNNEKIIEIYKQSLSKVSKSGYINYSDKFLNNKGDHYTEFAGTQMLGGREVNVTAWNRNKLARVPNDKNYYLCMDIPAGGYIYTIFVKASRPISELGGYTYLTDSFKLTAASRSPYNRKSRPVNVDERGWNDETAAYYLQYFGSDAERTFGIFEPDTAMFNYNTLENYEKNFEYSFPILLNYSEFENQYYHPNLAQRLQAAYEHGKTLELTIQTTAKAEGNMMYDILNGDYDQFLYSYATSIKDFGHPVLFRPMNEMNGDWCPYSGYNTSKDTLIFKETYRYMHDIFEEVGANNVIWIWNPNADSFPDFNWNNALMYYPGDEYVDVIGMTAYNTGTYYAATGETWQEFKTLYDSLYYEYCALFGQPFMITEFASASMGGDKNQWVINMFNQIENYDRIKVAIWWDGCDWDAQGNVARSYVMDESQELLDTFRKYLKAPWDKDLYA